MRIQKSVAVIVLLSVVISIFAGCGMTAHKYVAARYGKDNPEFGKPDLNGIVKEGDFIACNDDNLLKFQGYYKGLDYITLVFEVSSPIDAKMVKRCAGESHSGSLQGVIYDKDLDHEYVTFQYETFIYEKNGEVIQSDKTKTVNSFRFPLSDNEPASYYYLNIKGYSNNKYKDVDMVISLRTQTTVVEQSYWTDYKYDETIQYYNAGTEKWTQEEINDQMTDNMPLE